MECFLIGLALRRRRWRLFDQGRGRHRILFFGCRLPTVTKFGNETRLTVIKFENDAEPWFKVSINGKEYETMANSNPLEYPKMRVYNARHHTPVLGQMRHLIIKTW